MINRTFDNDETFPKRFIDYWEEYRSIAAGRPETMLKKMVYFHNTLFPDFAMSECLNCGSRWKRAEDKLDIAYGIIKAEFDYVKTIVQEVEEESFLTDTQTDAQVEAFLAANPHYVKTIVEEVEEESFFIDTQTDAQTNDLTQSDTTTQPEKKVSTKKRKSTKK